MLIDHLLIASGSGVGFGRGKQIDFPAATPGKVLTAPRGHRSMVDMNVALGARLLGLETPLATCVNAGQLLTFPCFSFPMCKMGIIIPTKQGYCGHPIIL